MEKRVKIETDKFLNKRVKIIADEDEEFEGVMLYSYDPSVILLKLDNGYNIGIKKEKIKKIELIRQERKKEKGEGEKKEEKGKRKEEKLKQARQKQKPKVAFIVTGGTIASCLDYETGAVKPLTRAEEILQIAPKISEIAEPVIECPFLVFSENINAEHFKKIAKIVESKLNDRSVQGVVVLSGTDTAHYIASALAFMLGKINKPVVLTCSQRSIDRGSSDALLNLTCSCYIALSDIAEVTLVSHASLSDEYCWCLRATKCRKMHTSRRDTFRPINSKPLAIVWPDGKIKILQEYNKRSEGKVKAESFFEEKTALIKWHPNADPALLEFLLKQGYKGVVIEATGFGHVAIEGKFSWFNAIKKCVESGMIVAFAPQTLYGRLDPFVYETGRKLAKLGVLYLHDILPETAYIKLAWLLGKEKDKEKVKQLMLENIANEFNFRLSSQDFLI